MALEEGGEPRTFIRGDRAQGTIGTVVDDAPLTERVEELMDGRGIGHNTERVEIPRICGARQCHAPRKISDAFAHFAPAALALAVADPLAINQEAARLGMKNTRFATATGLPAAQQVSTANDLALLAAAIIRDFPEYYPLYSIKEYRYNNISQSNRNRLLWSDPYVDGMKTGFTDGAGYCLIASAKRGPRRLLAVVLGAPSDSAPGIPVAGSGVTANAT